MKASGDLKNKIWLQLYLKRMQIGPSYVSGVTTPESSLVSFLNVGTSLKTYLEEKIKSLANTPTKQVRF